MDLIFKKGAVRVSHKMIGSILGLAGAQIFTFVLFKLFSEPCQNAIGLPDQCVWGFTMGEYWASYGTGASVFFVVIGYLIGRGWE